MSSRATSLKHLGKKQEIVSLLLCTDEAAVGEMYGTSDPDLGLHDLQ